MSLLKRGIKRKMNFFCMTKSGRNFLEVLKQKISIFVGEMIFVQPFYDNF